MQARYLACLLLALAPLAGCDERNHFTVISSGYTSIEDGAISIESSQIVLNPKHGPSATIGGSGDFAVDGKPVQITPAQRALLLQYYVGAMAVREDGVATGKAATTAAGKAVKQALSSDDKGKDKIGAEGDKISKAASKICDDLAQIRDAQDQLATQLDAFKPYAQLITAQSVSECRKGDND
jgi:hypothetical protein